MCAAKRREAAKVERERALLYGDDVFGYLEKEVEPEEYEERKRLGKQVKKLRQEADEEERQQTSRCTCTSGCSKSWFGFGKPWCRVDPSCAKQVAETLPDKQWPLQDMRGPFRYCTNNNQAVATAGAGESVTTKGKRSKGGPR